MKLFTLSPYPASLHAKQATGTATVPSSGFLRLERSKRRLVPVLRAGGQLSTNSLLLAFFLPFSLLMGAIFAGLRISDQLDEKYMSEIEKNLTIMEENGMLNEEIFKDIDGETLNKMLNEKEELVPATKARSRPRREI